MNLLGAGNTILGTQVARIIESKNPKFPKNSYVCCRYGWCSHSIIAPGDDVWCYVLPDFGTLPRSLGIGCLGMPGNTAYFGFLEICKPQPGETVVVTGAAGAVGSLVGQIAKIKGCKVIGFVGSDEKCEWIKSLGFDEAINYKKGNLKKALKTAAPEGVDCYFDNVGGEISNVIIHQMNLYGRISVCGAVSAYNDRREEGTKVGILQPIMVFQQLQMEGFVVYRWKDRWMEGINQMKAWIQEGKITYRETITEGFENLPRAFMDVLNGRNLGKGVVSMAKITDLSKL